MTGKIYLLPITLGESDPNDVIPVNVVKIITSLRCFIVENVRTTRRYLRQLDPQFPIDESVFYELNQHTKPEDIGTYIQPALNGQNIGIMSEAGVPGVADPGADVVNIAHQHQLQVVPLVGPSSILMAIMASGLNGQNFAFNGYLPVKPNDRIKALKHFEKQAYSDNQAQAFIETPYRNNALIKDMVENLLPETRLCIASGISTGQEMIKTMTVKKWMNNQPDLNKIPTVFVIGR